MILHTVNKSPFEKNTLESCLKNCKPGSSLLLIEDGIYASLNNTRFTEKVTASMKDINIYVLEPDLNARGVQDSLIDGIKKVDYAGYVDLTVEHSAVNAWL
ncbi:MAG: sulfurtransferase complex subunit TusB [Gammaproteobacteria bacterium]|nr:sulfurtransferase complex subunit TusB [Gammaproteobacteria bacterium]